jgi:hypothetical protein
MSEKEEFWAFCEKRRSERYAALIAGIESAPHDREILVYNAMYGWYRTRSYEVDGKRVWPLYGLMGAEGGVWYSVPSHWMDVPPTPDGASGPMMREQLGDAEFHDKRIRAERQLSESAQR